jgi:hypothetical protein
MGYTRAEAQAELRYGYDEWEFMRIFPPTAGEIAGAPLLMCSPGGLWNNRGDDALALSGDLATLSDILRPLGWYIAVVSHQPVFSAADWRSQAFTAKAWPGPLKSFARALSFLLSNTTYQSEYGSSFLTSSTASIDPTKACVAGHSSAGGLAMLLATIPPGRFPIDGIVGLEIDNYPYNAFPRPRAAVNIEGQLDWTQYVFPTDGGLGLVYDQDSHQAIAPDIAVGPWLSWTATPLSIKKTMSPLWWVLAGYPGARNIRCYHSYRNVADAYGANLTGDDFVPGVPQADFAGQKAFAEPHCRYQVYGAAKYWTLARIPNRCSLGTSIVTYSGGAWTVAAGAISSRMQDVASYLQSAVST